ncbi:aminoglycoside phosphotransferase [Sphingobium sp. TA15]|uniref:Putative aminoglycoside phosphotransferase n=1 Tax=Sphingobium indicum (strain DSM 16413 / CCM 7287 / MTCC 6362 / UT26 / NBRC 101211 / UT26S) TaxID=452662 RepID=D4Z274_SPHIU|nr:phosphotransferase family protein [Sphingobium indicum]BAI96706.1 putative aminoglycoside phosphotransferase [Sphingobium indicum UT26S]BDD66141.1 aminoglycoside phosphotransferase [Sphingobium sp. TA15]
MTASPSTIESQRSASGLPLEAFTAILREQLPDLRGPIEVRPIAAGQSNPTFFVEFGGRSFVLRKQPDGELLPSAHAIDREYRVMKALAASAVPVPQMLFFHADRDALGTPFYLMEKVNGRVFHDSAMPDLTVADRHSAYLASAATLADLHSIDPASIGLADYGRPGDYFERQIKRWSGQYERDRTRDLPGMDRLIAWLRAEIPQDDGLTSICHGDYRMGNLMYQPSGSGIVAVLDWELSTLGHPLADLAYSMMFWRLPPNIFSGIAGLDWNALGIPDERAYATHYFERRNMDDTLSAFHRAFAFFRFALIAEGVAVRAQKGNAAANDAEEVGGFALAFTEAALSFVDGGAAY